MENLWEDDAASAASVESWQWKISHCLESDVVVLMRQKYESAKDTQEQRNIYVVACRADGMSREDFVQHINSRFPGNRMANRRARLLLAWWKKTGEGKRPKNVVGGCPPNCLGAVPPMIRIKSAATLCPNLDCAQQ